MSLPIALRSALLSNTALAAEVSERVYYLRFPQDSAVEPAVTFQPKDNVQLATVGGTSVLLNPAITLILRAQSLATLETMRQAIHDQWNTPEVVVPGYAAVQCLINDLGAQYDDTLNVYHHYITLNLSMRTF